MLLRLSLLLGGDGQMTCEWGLRPLTPTPFQPRCLPEFKLGLTPASSKAIIHPHLFYFVYLFIFIFTVHFLPGKDGLSFSFYCFCTHSSQLISVKMYVMGNFSSWFPLPTRPYEGPVSEDWQEGPWFYYPKCIRNHTRPKNLKNRLEKYLANQAFFFLRFRASQWHLGPPGGLRG